MVWWEGSLFQKMKIVQTLFTKWIGFSSPFILRFSFLKIKRPKKLKKIIQNMVFLWAPIYITRQPGYQIQIRFEMWRDLNCECLFIRTNLIVHKGNGAEISEFCKGFVRRVKWKGPLNWIDHQKSLQFLTAVSSCLLPYYIRDFYILRWFDDSCAIRWPSVLSYGVS